MHQNSITAVLERHAAAPDIDDTVLDQLMPLVYDELRTLARRQLARELGCVTLDTTALVHEAYLKLVDQTRISGKGRAYFFGAAARAMRQILVDGARRRRRLKRGGGVRCLTLEEAFCGVDGLATEVLELEDAMQRLAEIFPRQARVVECRFYGGLTVEETAQALGVSARTIKSDWALAKAWLFDDLKVGS